MKNNKIVLSKEAKNSLEQRFKSENLNIEQLNSLIGSMTAMGIISSIGDNPDGVYQFIKICLLLNKNPITKEIYAVRYGDSFSIVIAYQEYIKRAQSNPNYQGFETRLVDKDNNGKPLGMNDIHIEFRCFPKNGRHEYTQVFYMREGKKNKGEGLTKPIHMLNKTAIKNGLAVCFPNEVGSYQQVEYNEEDKEQQIEIKEMNLLKGVMDNE